ncbi:MAG: hypothetical protein ABJN04_05940 [Hyphomicrobiales bacterium]
MAIADLFEAVVEGMEEQTLNAFLVALIKSGKSDDLETDSDQRRYVAIVRYLLGVADFLTRKDAAEAALNTKGLPSEIYLYFACDNIQIAEVFLDPTFELSEDDLLHVIKHCSRAHRLGLLDREDLTPNLRQEILRHNEVDVIRAMNENEERAIFFEYDDSLVIEDKNAELEGYGFDVDNELEIENPLDLMIKAFVENSRFADIIELLAKQGDTSKEMVKSMFSRKEAEPISIYCRGIGVGTEAFSALAKFRCRRLGQMERLAENTIVAYDEISHEYAQAMLVDLKQQSPQLARKMFGK